MSRLFGIMIICSKKSHSQPPHMLSYTNIFVMDFTCSTDNSRKLK